MKISVTYQNYRHAEAAFRFEFSDLLATGEDVPDIDSSIERRAR